MTPVAAMDGTVFALVVVGVVVVGVVAALVGSLISRDAYHHVGRGGISAEPDAVGPAGPPPDDQREEEIRQLLDARRERGARRGAAPPGGGGPAARVDVPAAGDRGPATAAPGTGTPSDRGEVPAGGDRGPAAAAAPPASQAGLAAELRELAAARNDHRRRRGLEPLDVEAEVARRLREL